MKPASYFTGLAVACVLGLSSTASAQLIEWQESVPMFDLDLGTVQTFVDTTGNPAVGLNASGDTSVNGDTGLLNADVVVNGVSFTGTPMGVTLGGAGDETITINGGVNNVGTFGDGNFNRDGDIFNLLRGAVFQVETVTLGGLEVGQEYLIQVFVHDGRNSRNTNTVAGFGDGSGSDMPSGTAVHNNRDPAVPGNPNDPDFDPDAPVQIDVGNSIIGTFTADATTLTFIAFGSDNGGETFAQTNPPDAVVGQAQVNAIQLRRVEEVDGVLLGDANCDTEVNFLDITPFIELLSSGGFKAEADINMDGEVTFLDIAPFIQFLATAGS